MNNEQQELLYKGYGKALLELAFDWLPYTPPTPPLDTIESFINKCKTDDDFAKRWGLTVEERELSLEERREISPNSKTTDMFKDLAIDFNPDVKMGCWNDQMSLEDFNDDTKKEIHKLYDRENIPTKLITITYNNKTIESYE
jgi:hypothetical protein